MRLNLSVFLVVLASISAVSLSWADGASESIDRVDSPVEVSSKASSNASSSVAPENLVKTKTKSNQSND